MKRNKVVIVAVALAVVVGLACLLVFVVEPWQAKREAQEALNATPELTKSAVVASNTEMVSYPTTEDTYLSGSNPKQLSLNTDPYFEFKSEKSSDKSHLVEVYLDFYSQRSRDFIAYNQETLGNSISSGKIILRVYPVVDEDGFSVYAPEALAEVFGTHGDLAWAFFTKLMTESSSILSPTTTEATEATTQEVIDFIASISQEVGVPTGSPDGVDANSIKYLSFFSWLYSGTTSPRLKVGYYPPIVYIDGAELDQDKWNLSDPTSVSSLFLELS